jgi:hypothetical protein
MNSHAIDLRKWVGLREREEAGQEREKRGNEKFVFLKI